MNNPREDDLEAMFRIIRCLKMTPGNGPFFEKNKDKRIKVFTDTD